MENAPGEQDRSRRKPASPISWIFKVLLLFFAVSCIEGFSLKESPKRPKINAGVDETGFPFVDRPRCGFPFLRRDALANSRQLVSGQAVE
jgi:hypothetical protein